MNRQTCESWWQQLRTMACTLAVLTAFVWRPDAVAAQQAGNMNRVPGEWEWINGQWVQQEFMYGTPRYMPGLMPGEVIDLYPDHLVQFTENVTRPVMEIQNGIERDRRHASLPEYQFTPESVVPPEFGRIRPGVGGAFLRGGRLLSMQGSSASTVNYWGQWRDLGQRDFDQMQLLKRDSAWEFYADGTFAHIEVGQRQRMQEGAMPEPIVGRWSVDPATGEIHITCNERSGGSAGGGSLTFEGIVRRVDGVWVAEMLYSYSGAAAFSGYGYAAVSSSNTVRYSLELQEVQ